jgi:glycosyltransferase involved in cell wall biosynthesis
LAPGIGGSVRSLLTVLAGLDDLHRIVAVPVPSSVSELLAERRLCEEIVPLDVGRRRSRLARVLLAVGLTTWLLKNKSKIIAIHVNGTAELNLVGTAAAVLRLPVVVWFHEWEVSRAARVLGPVWDRALANVRWVAVSQTSKQALERARITKGPVAVVPNPIDPADVLAAGPRERSQFTIAYIGTPARYKGFHLLPDIIRGVADLPVTWRIFSGPESMEPDVWEQLHALEGSCVHLCGKVADVRLAYGSCDLVVCPSLHESFGRVVAEAMANGLPVVASDLEAVREVAGDDEAAILVQPGDPDAFARAIRRAYRDDGLRARLGEAGRRRVQAFHPEVAWVAFRSLYGLAPRPGTDAGAPR